MENVKTFFEYFIWVGLLLTIIETYLTINKVWKRKHEQVVADSISIMGKIVGLIPVIVYSAYFMLKVDWPGLANRIVVLFMMILFILVGTGWFVVGQRKKGFKKLFMRSFKLERDEVGDLAKSFFHPSGADKILNILGQVAYIDKELDEREKMFIQKFADSWGIHFSWDEVIKNLSSDEKENHYQKLRNSMITYLQTTPPPTQVSQLRDILHLLVNIDDKVTKEERLILTELTGLIDSYLGSNKNISLFNVAVIPQNEEQAKAIENLLAKNFMKTKVAGGFAYLTEPFYSEEYAEIICEQFRGNDLFTVVVKPDRKRDVKYIIRNNDKTNKL